MNEKKGERIVSHFERNPYPGIDLKDKGIQYAMALGYLEAIKKAEDLVWVLEDHYCEYDNGGKICTSCSALTKWRKIK